MKDIDLDEAIFDRYGAGEQTAGVLEEVAKERRRQNVKFPNQDLPNGNNPRAYGALAEMAKTTCNEAAKHRELTWRHVLLEEVYEALECDADEEFEGEMLQVAAVAVACVENSRRRRGVA